MVRERGKRPEIDESDSVATARTSPTVTRPRAVQTDDVSGSVEDAVETIVHVLRHGEVHNPKGIL